MLLPENIRIGKVSRITWDGYVYLNEIFPENSYRRHVAFLSKFQAMEENPIKS